MTDTTHTPGKGKVTAYWIITGLVALGMFSGGFVQIFHAKWNVEGMIHLGYPLYFMTLIGIWKVSGAIVLLVPGFLLLKEWAYAGFFFLMTGAIVSHLAAGDGLQGVISQSIFVLLIVLSWYLRPENRKLQVKTTF